MRGQHFLCLFRSAVCTCFVCTCFVRTCICLHMFCLHMSCSHMYLFAHVLFAHVLFAHVFVCTCFVRVATPVGSGPAVPFRTQRPAVLCVDLVLTEPKADVHRSCIDTRTASQTQDTWIHPPHPPPPYQYASRKHAKISSGTFKLCHLAQSVF